MYFDGERQFKDLDDIADCFVQEMLEKVEKKNMRIERGISAYVDYGLARIGCRGIYAFGKNFSFEKQSLTDPLALSQVANSICFPKEEISEVD